MSCAGVTYIKKSVERLYGIIEGITIDYELNDLEIAALKNWLDSHEEMKNNEPFNGLCRLLDDILADNVIDAGEREDLLEWCADTINEQGFPKDITKIIRRLHGIIAGILSDKIIRTEELEGLQDWLLDYEHLKGHWPLNELTKQIKKILKDGKIDDQEHVFLENFFKDFSEQILENPKIYDQEYNTEEHMISASPIFKSVSFICEKMPEIDFNEKTFCFTGPAETGSRKDLFKITQKLGGQPHKSIIVSLDYLVVGAQSSPAWIYSTYGRKIEAVMNNKKKTGTQIISEYDFIKAAKEQGGNDIVPDPGKPLFKYQFINEKAQENRL